MANLGNARAGKVRNSPAVLKRVALCQGLPGAWAIVKVMQGCTVAGLFCTGMWHTRIHLLNTLRNLCIRISNHT